MYMYIGGVNTWPAAVLQSSWHATNWTSSKCRHDDRNERRLVALNQFDDATDFRLPDVSEKKNTPLAFSLIFLATGKNCEPRTFRDILHFVTGLTSHPWCKFCQSTLLCWQCSVTSSYHRISPRYGPIFNDRQSCHMAYRKRLRDEQHNETTSYTNESNQITFICFSSLYS